MAPKGFRERLRGLLAKVTPEKAVGAGGLTVLCAAADGPRRSAKS